MTSAQEYFLCTSSLGVQIGTTAHKQSATKVVIDWYESLVSSDNIHGVCPGRKNDTGKFSDGVNRDRCRRIFSNSRLQVSALSFPGCTFSGWRISVHVFLTNCLLQDPRMWTACELGREKCDSRARGLGCQWRPQASIPTKWVSAVYRFELQRSCDSQLNSTRIIFCCNHFRFESCWPAIARDTNGVIFVFNPDQPNHDKELESWWEKPCNLEYGMGHRRPSVCALSWGMWSLWSRTDVISRN